VQTTSGRIDLKDSSGTHVLSGGKPGQATTITSDMNVGEVLSDLKGAGVEVDADTKKAFKELENLKFPDEKMSKAINHIIKESTKAAVQSAAKAAKVDIAAAMSLVKNLPMAHPRLPEKKPH
jgi:hypothetical protein